MSGSLPRTPASSPRTGSPSTAERRSCSTPRGSSTTRSGTSSRPRAAPWNGRARPQCAHPAPALDRAPTRPDDQRGDPRGLRPGELRGRAGPAGTRGRDRLGLRRHLRRALEAARPPRRYPDDLAGQGRRAPLDLPERDLPAGPGRPGREGHGAAAICQRTPGLRGLARAKGDLAHLHPVGAGHSPPPRSGPRLQRPVAGGRQARHEGPATGRDRGRAFRAARDLAPGGRRHGGVADPGVRRRPQCLRARGRASPGT